MSLKSRNTYSSPHHNFLLALNDWLENRFATPAYGGWVALGIALSFFGAATNTMAGWLYVLSGTLLALIALNIFIAIKTLKRLQIKRSPIAPVSAGDELTIELNVINPTKSTKNLIQVVDKFPSILSSPMVNTIETIAPQEQLKLTYYAHAQKRGIYHWQDIDLKTAAPIGLFYSTRKRKIATRAIVYPQILPLKNCPLIDNLGREESRQRQSERLYQNSTEGVTKALRKYRFGDPIRLVHWRSSARFGDLQVRELETITVGQEIIICLDNSVHWQEEYFEQAVIAAASLYFYGSRQQLEVSLWTSDTGVIKGNKVVLETLAEVQSSSGIFPETPNLPSIWLSNNPDALVSLPDGSSWFLFPDEHNKINSPKTVSHSGIVYDFTESLENQLQKPL